MQFGLIEMILFFSIMLAFGIYELVAVRRALRDDGEGGNERDRT